MALIRSHGVMKQEAGRVCASAGATGGFETRPYEGVGEGGGRHGVGGFLSCEGMSAWGRRGQLHLRQDPVIGLPLLRLLISGRCPSASHEYPAGGPTVSFSDRSFPMKIVDIGVKVFTYRSKEVRDSEGHGHPGPEHDALQALITITADDGTAGYCFGSPGSARQAVLDQYVKPELIGRDPHDRELIWQGLYKRQRGSGDLIAGPPGGGRGDGPLGPRRPEAGLAGLEAPRGLPGQGTCLRLHDVRGRDGRRAGYAGGLRQIRRVDGEPGVPGDQAAHLDAAGLMGARPQNGREGLRGCAGSGWPRSPV